MQNRATPDNHPTSRQGGFALLMVMLSMVFVGSIGLVFLQDAMSGRADVDFESHRVRAFEIAESALVMSELELRGNRDPDGDGSGTLSGGYGGGTFTVVAEPLGSSTSEFRLSVVGRHGHAVRRLEAGVRKPPGGLFSWALFGKTGVEATGNSHTDAYDSDLGPYAGQITGTDSEGLTYAQALGHVGSNGEITTSGPIRGDAIPGPFDVVVQPANVWGSTTPRSEDAVIPDPPYSDFEAAFLANDNAGIDTSDPQVSYDPVGLELLAGGGSPITLTGGTYIFNTLKMTGGGDLQITGPSVIYITNEFELSGGAVANMTGVPANCQVFAHAYDFPPGSAHDKMTVRTSGGAATALAVYAPRFHVEVSGGGAVFGSLVGDTVTLSGGTAFHYDLALGRLGGGGTGPLERLYWVER